MKNFNIPLLSFTFLSILFLDVFRWFCLIEDLSFGIDFTLSCVNDEQNATGTSFRSRYSASPILNNFVLFTGWLLSCDNDEHNTTGFSYCRSISNSFWPCAWHWSVGNFLFLNGLLSGIFFGSTSLPSTGEECFCSRNLPKATTPLLYVRSWLRISLAANIV